MTKTYSNKSNAARAAAKVPGATIARIETAAGCQYAVVQPVIGETVYAMPGDGVDGPGQDDVPVLQIADGTFVNKDEALDAVAFLNTEDSAKDVDCAVAPAPGGYVVATVEQDDCSEAAVNARNAARARLRDAEVEAAFQAEKARYVDEKAATRAQNAVTAKATRKRTNVFPGVQVGGPVQDAPKAVRAKATVRATTAKAARVPGTPVVRTAGVRVAVQMAAEQGVMPMAPDFSASTHTPYRKKLASLVALIEARDLTAIRAFQINPTSTSPKALARYRDLATTALEAQAA